MQAMGAIMGSELTWFSTNIYSALLQAVFSASINTWKGFLLFVFIGSLTHNSSLKENPSLIFIFRGEYSISENGTVLVCIHGIQPGYKEALFDQCNVIISFTLNLVSIFSLTTTLITYILFKELRNLPGLNLMCLAACIFISRVRKHITKQFPSQTSVEATKIKLYISIYFEDCFQHWGERDTGGSGGM